MNYPISRREFVRMLVAAVSALVLSRFGAAALPIPQLIPPHTLIKTYPRNEILKLDASVITHNNIKISVYEWIINRSVVLDNLKSVSINTNDLLLGDNTISLRVKNSCGSWSEYVIKIVNIV